MLKFEKKKKKNLVFHIYGYNHNDKIVTKYHLYSFLKSSLPYSTIQKVISYTIDENSPFEIAFIQ